MVCFAVGRSLLDEGVADEIIMQRQLTSGRAVHETAYGIL
jgi:hypothetical protein